MKIVPLSALSIEVPMIRFACFSVSAVVMMVSAWPASAGDESMPAPTTYELMINGESFLVEANRVIKLESLRKPGVSYQVAIRVAPMQRLKLNTCQFDYDRLARIDDDRKTPQRTVRISHELGFNMLVTDLGQPLEAKARSELLEVLEQSLAATFREMGAEKVETAKPHTRQFAGASGRGIMVRYKDKQGYEHTGLAYVLSGADFTATCVVQYLDADKDDVLPLVKKTLDSFRAIRRP